MSDSNDEDLGVVLIGHGAPALDCPPQYVGELMSLEWRKGQAPHTHQHGGRAAELDAAIRDWPRNEKNDPYKVGLERVAAALKPLLPTERFIIGYNEFCRPSISEAIQQIVEQGAKRVLVVPSMLTPGGVHSEIDIPRTLEDARKQHPEVTIDYIWPFSLEEVAKLLASHLQRAVGVKA